MGVAYRIPTLAAASLAALMLACPAPSRAGTTSDNQRSTERTAFTAAEGLQAQVGRTSGARFFADSPEEHRAALASAPRAAQEP